MAKNLPTRPNLEHLRRQAKTLLAQLKDGEPAAARAFIRYLPEAKKLSAVKVRAGGFRLADAQSVIARQTGFGSWPLLSRHVQQLRLLEGEWHFAALQMDGMDVPASVLTQSRLLLDGDRFRMESPEANYDGVFTIDIGEEPARIDLEFVEGPEAGNWSYGIFELDGDRLTICLGLTGASRPVAFSTRPGSGHALERLRRAKAHRPAGVTGGTRATKAAGPMKLAVDPVAEGADAKRFDVEMTPLLRRLEGEWAPTQLTLDGTPMPNEWLSFGSRVATGNEIKVVFGGQTMVHARVRIDEQQTPITVDYLNVGGAQKGKVSLGIMEWVDEEVRFLMAAPGLPRPTNFADKPGKGQTLSQWRRRAER